MADGEKALEKVENTSAPEKSDNKAQFVLALAVLTLLAGLGGWSLGSYISKSVVKSAEPAPQMLQNTSSKEQDLLENTNIVKLPSLLTNLASPASTRIRLNVSLVVPKDVELSPDTAAEITSDFLLFLRTSTLEQLKGASGLFYLREDLLDRARIRSNGKVTGILIYSLVLE